MAPRDGQVIGVPHSSTVGQYLKPGKPLFEIGDPKKLEAHLILDQTDVDLINSRKTPTDSKPPPGSRSTGPPSGPGKSYRRPDRSERNQEEIPPELSNNAGGEIATKQDPKTGQAKP